MTPQKKATLISSSVAAILTLIKLVVGVASGSVAVLASAIDSVLDMFVSIFNFFAITNSEKPADEKFNYGRGKIEALASVIEGVIISLSGVFLFYQAVKKAIHEETSQYLEISLIVMLISTIITISLVLFLNKTAKETNSMIIKADALHYKTDVYTNIAVFVSLLLVTFTGFEIVDVIVGGAISIFIIYSAFELIKTGILELLDKAADETIVEDIIKIIKEEEKVNTFHLLKTREAANKIFVEVHLVFDCLITLMEAHRVSDKVEDKIKNLDKNKQWVINIHLDPYDDLEIDHQN